MLKGFSKGGIHHARNIKISKAEAIADFPLPDNRRRAVVATYRRPGGVPCVSQRRSRCGSGQVIGYGRQDSSRRTFTRPVSGTVVAVDASSGYGRQFAVRRSTIARRRRCLDRHRSTAANRLVKERAIFLKKRSSTKITECRSGRHGGSYFPDPCQAGRSGRQNGRNADRQRRRMRTVPDGATTG